MLEFLPPTTAHRQMSTMSIAWTGGSLLISGMPPSGKLKYVSVERREENLDFVG
jgi:hypothetical protein